MGLNPTVGQNFFLEIFNLAYQNFNIHDKWNPKKASNKYLLRISVKKMWKNTWLQGDLNPGLLARLAEVLPLDQGKWISHKKMYKEIDLLDYYFS